MRRRKIVYDLEKDYYKILGVDLTATADQIQQAYRQRAKQLHPDFNPDQVEWATLQFQLLSEAYDVLSDQDLRSDYNTQRWAHIPFSSPPNGKKQDEEWWTKPHNPPQPGYQGVRRSPRKPPPGFTYTPPERPGKWLSRWGLGFVRP